MGVLSFVAALAFASIASVALASCLRIRSAAAFGLTAYLFGWALVICVAYALSLGKWVERSTLLLAYAAIAVAAVGVWLVAGRPVPPLARWAATGRRGLEDHVLRVLVGAVAVTYAYSLALSVGTAANDGDPLVYELTRGALWRQLGGVGAVNTTYDTRLDISPPHAEIAQFTTMVLSESERFVAVGQFAAVFALALGVVGIGRRIGMPGRQAAFGALLVPLLPIVLVQSWTGFTDVVFASFLVAAVFFALGSARIELLPFGLAIGLLLGTKFLGPVLLPLLALVVLAGQPPRRYPGFALAGVAGGLFGGIWYVANALRADEAIGDVDQGGFQELALRPVAASLSRYAVELFDLSGAVDGDVLLYGAVGLGLVLAALVVRRWDRAERVGLVLAGALVALLPLSVAVGRRTVAAVGDVSWNAVGRSESVGRWFTTYDTQQTAADGALSWFGPVGVVLAIATVPLAIQAARRAEVRRAALVLAAAPAIAILCLALTIIYLRYQGRYFISGIALSAALWGLVCRWQAAKVAVATASILTAFLCLANALGKPSGLELLKTDTPETVWGMPRWEQQGLLRPSPPERDEINTIRFVEENVPLDARIGLALEENDFGFPYFGPKLTRFVTIVDVGDSLSDSIQWLVAAPGRRLDGCVPAWRRERRGPGGWEVWRRVATNAACR